MKPDISLVAQVTDNCNLNCTYCYMDRNRPHRNMSDEVAEALIEKTLEYNDQFAHFTWIGGEPLLRKNSFWERIIEFGEKHNKKNLDVTHSIQTNGLALTEERYNSLRDMGYKIGGSFDGCLDLQDSNRVTHNLLPVGERILQNLNAVSGNLGLISVLSKPMIGREEEVYSNLKSLTDRARINFFTPSGGSLGGLDSLLPSEEEAEQSIKKFYTLWKEDDSGFILNPFTSIIRGLFLGWVKTCDFSAYACYRIIGSNPEGEIYLCSRATHLPELKIGDIKRQSLDDIIGNEGHQVILDRYNSLKEDKCKDCDILPYCSGGCPIEAYSYKNNIFEKTYYCEPRKELFNTIRKDLEDSNVKSRLLRKTGLKR